MYVDLGLKVPEASIFAMVTNVAGPLNLTKLYTAPYESLELAGGL